MSLSPFRRPALLVLAVAALAAAGPSPGTAQRPGRMVIDIGDPNAAPLPIAVAPLAGTGEAAKFGRDIAQVVAANLERSGLFAPVPQGSFPQTPEAIGAAPDFAGWERAGAAGLVSGAAAMQGDGRLKIEFRLWDVFARQQATGLQYFTQPGNWRRIAHIISDAIYKRATGEEGYFDTRLVYVAETGPGNRREKRLAIMDQDGANHRFLTSGRLPNGQPELVLTPRFSPSTQEITYLAYVNDQPRVYLFNIETGRREVVGDFPGMTFAPRFSPDGNRVVMSMARGGNTDIWAMDLRSRRQQRLTDHPAIDTSPSYAPDGSQIVFNSDRGGSQQLYVMDAGGGSVRALTRPPGRYGTPVWSPRGDLIAFTKQASGRFQIGVVRPDGAGERILAESYLDEAPTWSPNGRVVIFFRQSPANSRGVATSRLISVDLTGRNERVVSTPTDASDPAWSPLNQ